MSQAPSTTHRSPTMTAPQPHPSAPQKNHRILLPQATLEALHQWLHDNATAIRTGHIRIPAAAKTQLFAGDRVTSSTIYRTMKKLGITTPRTSLDQEATTGTPPWPRAADRMREAAGPTGTPENIAATISTIYGISESEVYDYLTAPRTLPTSDDRLLNLERQLDDLQAQLLIHADILAKLKPLID